MRLMRWIARVGDRLPRALLDAETLAMLSRGTTAAVGNTKALLGRAP
jgi:hypothetical protein